MHECGVMCVLCVMWVIESPTPHRITFSEYRYDCRIKYVGVQMSSAIITATGLTAHAHNFSV